MKRWDALCSLNCCNVIKKGFCKESVRVENPCTPKIPLNWDNRSPSPSDLPKPCKSPEGCISDWNNNCGFNGGDFFIKFHNSSCNLSLDSCNILDLSFTLESYPLINLVIWGSMPKDIRDEDIFSQHSMLSEYWVEDIDSRSTNERFACTFFLFSWGLTHKHDVGVGIAYRSYIGSEASHEQLTMYLDPLQLLVCCPYEAQLSSLLLLGSRS